VAALEHRQPLNASLTKVKKVDAKKDNLDGSAVNGGDSK